MISFNPYMGTLIESKEWEENAIKKIDELESENARLRAELERLKSIVGEIDFKLIEEVLDEANKDK